MRLVLCSLLGWLLTSFIALVLMPVSTMVMLRKLGSLLTWLVHSEEF
jgi:hypothetical protein